MGDELVFSVDKNKVSYKVTDKNKVSCNIVNNNKVLYSVVDKNKVSYKVEVIGGRGKEGKSAYELAVENGFVGTVEEWLDSFSNVCERNSVYEFPNIGKPNVLYIDKGGNGTYRWDDVARKYYCIGKDYTQIRCIDGGKANNG